MKAILALAGLAACCWWAAPVLAAPGTAGAAYLPRTGDQVLETLRATPGDPAARELRAWQAKRAAEPTNVLVACEVARRCVERSRHDADPRYLGRAQAALAPWWDAPAAPVEVLILRATLRQSQHDFIRALADLDLAAGLAPRNPQVWLTRVTILTLQGEYAAARRACGPLAQLAPGLISLTAASGIATLNGDAERACARLRGALAGAGTAGAGERVWALTVLAEAETRAGRFVEAEADFQRALNLAPRDPYLLGAYADLLLDLGRPREAVQLIGAEPRADGLLLRLAIAEASLTPPPATFVAHAAALRARFEAGRLRGDFVHQREEARYLLEVAGDPRAALPVARANWDVQREPADARLLLAAARGAGDPAAAAPVLDFVRTNRLEDTVLARWAGQLSPNQ